MSSFFLLSFTNFLNPSTSCLEPNIWICSGSNTTYVSIFDFCLNKLSLPTIPSIFGESCFIFNTLSYSIGKSFSIFKFVIFNNTFLTLGLKISNLSTTILSYASLNCDNVNKEYSPPLESLSQYKSISFFSCCLLKLNSFTKDGLILTFIPSPVSSNKSLNLKLIDISNEISLFVPLK